ncbi:hypothetical protein HYV31_02280 [candidate division WWE3 bacterium]|nr:hypothetical protein [candidate division WWE3 bacterium]
MNRRISYSLAFLFLTTFLILFLWEQVILLLCLLILIAYAKHIVIPIKKELLWFVLISGVGGFTEIILVNFGHMWSYTGPSFLGVPVQMMLFWGVIGTVAVVIYKELISE